MTETVLVTIDYDPGASEVNQLNRIKLMLATAHLIHEPSGTAAASEPSEGVAVPELAETPSPSRTLVTTSGSVA